MSLTITNLVGFGAGRQGTINLALGPYRYWRIFATTNNGDASFIGIGELEFYETPYNGVNVLTGGTISASSQFSGTLAASKAIDGNYDLSVNSRWASSATGGTDEWIMYDFGAGVTKEVQAVALFSCADGEQDQTIGNYRVEYSADGSTFFTAWSGSFPTLTHQMQFARSINPVHVPSYSGSPYGAHTYWRALVQTPDGSALSCSEMEMRATPSGSDQCTGGTPTVNASTLGSATSIFDNNNSTFWAVNGGAGSWIKYQFASPVTVAEISWRIRGDANPTHAPNDFLIQFSDDNTLWTTCWQVFDQTAWSIGETRVFTSPDYI